MLNGRSRSRFASMEDRCTDLSVMPSLGPLCLANAYNISCMALCVGKSNARASCNSIYLANVFMRHRRLNTKEEGKTRPLYTEAVNPSKEHHVHASSVDLRSAPRQLLHGDRSQGIHHG